MPDIETIKGQTEDQIPPETVEEKEDVVEQPKNEVTEILREIDKKLTPKEPASTGPTPQQIYAAKRESLKERFGWNDDQMDAYEADKAESMAPIKEELAWTKLKSEASSLTPEIEADMKEELKQYAAHLRGDKVLLEKIYYMTLGKRTSLNKHVPVKETVNSDKGDDIVSRRIVNSGGGSSVSLGTSSSPRGPKLTDEEKIYARKMRMTDEDYSRYKENDSVESFKKK